jgi:hypothetical protein
MLLTSLQRRAEQGVTTFTLQLIYGLVIFPEYAPFSHSAVVDAVLLDIGMPLDYAKLLLNGFLSLMIALKGNWQ